MSLENAIAELTAAVKAQTIAIETFMKGQPATVTVSEPMTAEVETVKTETKTRGRPAKADKVESKPKGRSVDEAQALLIKIKDGHGIAAAREILTANGLSKMAEINADNAAKVYEDAKRWLEGGVEEETETSDDL